MPTPTFPDALDDLIVGSVKDYHAHKGTWSDISMNFPEYCFAEKMLMGKKTTVSDPSTSLIFDLQYANSGTLRTVGHYDTDSEERRNILVQGEVKWTSQNIGIYFDKLETVIGKGKTEIVDHIQAQIHGMYNVYFEGMSVKMWDSPASSSDADRDLLGIPHWVVQHATEGFNGGDPANFSAGAAGIDSDTYTGWKNYSGTYSAIDHADLVTKVIRAMRRCDFKPPHNYAEAVKQGGKYQHFTTEAVYEALDLLLRGQNDNLGSDLGAFRGQALLKSVPITISWELTKSTLSDGTANPAYDANDPWYGIYWPSFKINFIKGYERKITGPERSATGRFVRKINLDSWNQMYNINRRNNFVLYQA